MSRWCKPLHFTRVPAGYLAVAVARTLLLAAAESLIAADVLICATLSRRMPAPIRRELSRLTVQHARRCPRCRPEPRNRVSIDDDAIAAPAPETEKHRKQRPPPSFAVGVGDLRRMSARQAASAVDVRLRSSPYGQPALATGTRMARHRARRASPHAAASESRTASPGLMSRPVITCDNLQVLQPEAAATDRDRLGVRCCRCPSTPRPTARSGSGHHHRPAQRAGSAACSIWPLVQVTTERQQAHLFRPGPQRPAEYVLTEAESSIVVSDRRNAPRSRTSCRAARRPA